MHIVHINDHWYALGERLMWAGTLIGINVFWEGH